jgi:hypothetical protein
MLETVKITDGVDEKEMLGVDLFAVLIILQDHLKRKKTKFIHDIWNWKHHRKSYGVLRLGEYLYFSNQSV